MKQLWRVSVERTCEFDVYVAAESRAAAEELAEEEGLDFHSCEYDTNFHAQSAPITDLSKVDQYDLHELVIGAQPECTVQKWIEQGGDQEVLDLQELRNTPGTAEYRAALEAEGQATLGLEAGA